jgi:hypothetical protein
MLAREPVPPVGSLARAAATAVAAASAPRRMAVVVVPLDAAGEPIELAVGAAGMVARLSAPLEGEEESQEALAALLPWGAEAAAAAAAAGAGEAAVAARWAAMSPEARAAVLAYDLARAAEEEEEAEEAAAARGDAPRPWDAEPGGPETEAHWAALAAGDAGEWGAEPMAFS